MPSRGPARGAPAALMLMLACVMMTMATHAAAAASWKVELVPTPITRATYEATAALPATCFKISQAGAAAPPPTTLTIRSVAQACARTNKPPAFTVDGIPQDGAQTKRSLSSGTAALSARSSTLTLTLPAWAKDQKERVVCVTANAGACGTFAKICGNRATCPVAVGSPGASSPAPANLKTAPLATASHAMVLEYANAPSTLCATPGFPSLFPKIAEDYSKDARAQLAKELGRSKAAQIAVISFKPRFCSPVTDGKGKPTGRQGLGGYLTVTGPPDLVDDVLRILDRDNMPAPASTQSVCGGGCTKAAAVINAAVAGPADPANTVTSSPLIDALQAYIGNGFDVLQFNPYGKFKDNDPIDLNPSNWIRTDKVYDINSILAYCGPNDALCFNQQGSACASSLSSSYSASSAKRQSDIAVSAKVGVKYAGVTGSASAAFRSAQETIEESSSLSVVTAAECVVHTFLMPDDPSVLFSPTFTRNIKGYINAIIAAKKQAGANPSEAAKTVGRILDTMYKKYGTHVPTAFTYVGFMRLEVLVNVKALRDDYASAKELDVALSHAVADLSVKAAKNSTETTSLFSRTTSVSFINQPNEPSVPYQNDANGVPAIDAQAWTRALLNGTNVAQLYPKITQTISLSDILNAASIPGTSDALRFSDSFTDEQYDALATLATAYEAYVTNDVDLWKDTELPMPQLLADQNYFKNGKCASSDLIVKVNQTTSYGASYDCVTCVRGIQTLPTRPGVSLANPDNTASCIGDNGKVKVGACKQCVSASCLNNECCTSRYNGYTGTYAKPETCDDCQDCLNDSDCGSRNGQGSWLGGHGNVGETASCFFRDGKGFCVQCVNDRDCQKGHSCVNKNCNN